MGYKPLICEVKCISRDIKKSLESESTNSTRHKLSFEEIKELALGLSIAVVVGVILLAIMYFFEIIAFIFALLSLGWLAYRILQYINSVHERCIYKWKVK